MLSDDPRLRKIEAIVIARASPDPIPIGAEVCRYVEVLWHGTGKRWSKEAPVCSQFCHFAGSISKRDIYRLWHIRYGKKRVYVAN